MGQVVKIAQFKSIEAQRINAIWTVNSMKDGKEMDVRLVLIVKFLKVVLVKIVLIKDNGMMKQQIQIMELV